MASPQEITAAVKTALEQRLRTMGLSASPISAHELEQRFGRTTQAAGGLFYQLELAGHPCAYSLWPVAGPDGTAVQQKLDGEISALQAAGRAIAGSSTMIDKLANLYSEVLAAPTGDGAQAAAQPALERFIERVWDHDTMRAVYAALTSETGKAEEQGGPAQST